MAYAPTWIHPNHLSILRAACILPLIWAKDRPALAVSIAIFSALCDMLDGPLSRIRGQVSQTGAVLDATSDKIFVLGALVFVVWERVPFPISAAIIALDLVLTAMRPIKRWRGARSDANQWGAIKVWAQSFGLCFVLTGNPTLTFLAVPTFILAIALAVLSLVGHLRDIMAPRVP
ncbi:CDP-alcohol phosphatidyltransferase family protein [Candidatus Uhrbacteria bacterium]|nr:CDP-alcohol phosphatidyltransferase family protein [Candidatus Uhrbacteria bacterium]